MKRLPLDKWHSKYGKMEDFAGWHMPLWYDGIKQEHMAVRNGVGMFDVSHMGEIIFKGPDALVFLQWTTTNDISKPPPISGTYTLVLNERGAIKDETLVYNMGNDTYMMVCDAVARPKLTSYFKALKETIGRFAEIDLKVDDQTDTTCLYSIQGPKAHQLCNDIFDINLNEMWWFQAKEVHFGGKGVILSKSGYTGENGFELFFIPDGDKEATDLWEHIIHMGKKYSITPCGLGARDTLRIESGYTLYGNETYEGQIMSEWVDEITPFEAGLDFALFMEKEFIGRDSLMMQKKEGIKKKLVHMKLIEKSISRSGDKIYCNGKPIGIVTSGTKTPLLDHSVAIGYVDIGNEGEIYIDIRGKMRKAQIVDAPFYNPKRFGAYREM